MSHTDHPSTHDLVTRQPTMADAAAVAGLINVCAVAEIGALQMTVEQLRQRWQSPGFNLATDSWVVVLPGGAIIAYAEVWDRHPQGAPYLWGRVHPDHTGRGLGRYLLRLAEGRARQALTRASRPERLILRTAVVSANQPARRLLYGDGYRLAQRFWCQSRPADGLAPAPGWPQDIPAGAYVSTQEDGPVYRYDIYEKELYAGGTAEMPLYVD